MGQGLARHFFKRRVAAEEAIGVLSKKGQLLIQDVPILASPGVPGVIFMIQFRAGIPPLELLIGRVNIRPDFRAFPIILPFAGIIYNGLMRVNNHQGHGAAPRLIGQALAPELEHFAV
jgi:hypothetical protein